MTNSGARVWTDTDVHRPISAHDLTGFSDCCGRLGGRLSGRECHYSGGEEGNDKSGGLHSDCWCSRLLGMVKKWLLVLEVAWGSRGEFGDEL